MPGQFFRGKFLGNLLGSRYRPYREAMTTVMGRTMFRKLWGWAAEYEGRTYWRVPWSNVVYAPGWKAWRISTWATLKVVARYKLGIGR